VRAANVALDDADQRLVDLAEDLLDLDIEADRFAQQDAERVAVVEHDREHAAQLLGAHRDRGGAGHVLGRRILVVARLLLHQALHAIERLAQDRGEHRLLVREVLVERAAADAGGLADMADVRRVKATLREDPLRTGEDLALAGL
jgi:hypothetical protein